MTQAGKFCRVCKRWRPLDDFYRHPSGADGRDYRCKGCKTSGLTIANYGQWVEVRQAITEANEGEQERRTFAYCPHCRKNHGLSRYDGSLWCVETAKIVAAQLTG